jgi:ElaB/YqjD/DUF883 family membrane-anchored ribosome-binding protein
MGLFITHRQAAKRHWRYVGRPYLTVIGVAGLVGLLVGLLWVAAGLLRFHPLW